MRDFSDNISIYESYQPPKAAKDYGLSDRENYYVWVRPVEDGKLVDKKQKIFTASANEIVKMLNETKRRYGNNPVAVYQIRTGQLVWFDDQQYDETKMTGHGYDVSIKNIKDDRNIGLYRVSVNGVNPIIVIPASDDDILNGWDRIIVEVIWHGGWKSKEKGNSKINRITYNNSFDGKATMQIHAKDTMEVANRLLWDGHDIATIARTIVQPEYVESIRKHMYGEVEKEVEETADILTKKLTYKANVKTGSGKMVLEEYPVEIIKVSDDGLKVVVNRLSNAIGYDELYIDSDPLMAGDAGNSWATKLHNKMRPETSDSVTGEAHSYYGDNGPHFLMAVVDKDEEFMFGLKYHVGTGTTSAARGVMSSGKKPFQPGKFFIQFAANPIPYQARKSTNSPLHPKIFKLLHDNDVLNYITIDLPNQLGHETAFHVVFQDAIWPKSMTDKMEGTKKGKTYKVRSSSTPHSGQSPEDKSFFTAYMIHMLTSRDFNDDEDEINAGGYAP
jgi:hypothetical protein